MTVMRVYITKSIHPPSHHISVYDIRRRRIERTWSPV